MSVIDVVVLAKRTQGVALIIRHRAGFEASRSGDLNGPKDLRVDSHDDVIISDTENHLIKKYRPKDGSTVAIAGTGVKGDRIIADDPLKTQLNRPHGIFLHHSGAVYISDSENHRVLRLSSA